MANGNLAAGGPETGPAREIGAGVADTFDGERTYLGWTVGVLWRSYSAWQVLSLRTGGNLRRFVRFYLIGIGLLMAISEIQLVFMENDDRIGVGVISQLIWVEQAVIYIGYFTVALMVLTFGRTSFRSAIGLHVSYLAAYFPIGNVVVVTAIVFLVALTHPNIFPWFGEAYVAWASSFPDGIWLGQLILGGIAVTVTLYAVSVYVVWVRHALEVVYWKIALAWVMVAFALIFTPHPIRDNALYYIGDIEIVPTKDGAFIRDLRKEEQ